MSEQERWPTLIERIRELTFGDEPLGPNVTVSYTWNHGYERYRIEHVEGGALEYVGVFHPVEGKCIGNPCEYCGMVWHD